MTTNSLSEMGTYFIGIIIMKNQDWKNFVLKQIKNLQKKDSGKKQRKIKKYLKYWIKLTKIRI